MLSLDRKSLISRLNTTCRNALEAATGFCLSRRHDEVGLEHLLVKLIATPDTDIERIFRHYQINQARLSQDLTVALERLQAHHSQMPALSSRVLDLIVEAWVFASINFRAERIRSGQLLLALLANAGFLQQAKEISAEFTAISAESLHHHFGDIVAGSIEDVEERTIAIVSGSAREDGNFEHGMSEQIRVITKNGKRYEWRFGASESLQQDFHQRGQMLVK